MNTCRKDLDLTQGTVSQTILKKGGKSIQGELRKNYDKLRFGEIAVTKGGLLPCDYIFHGALYNWTPVGDFSLKVRLLLYCIPFPYYIDNKNTERTLSILLFY